MSATKSPMSGRARREALLEAIGWLKYRATICREAEDRYSVENGYEPISSATERSARQELELAIREIAKLGTMNRRSREYREAAASRAAYMANQAAVTEEAT